MVTLDTLVNVATLLGFFVAVIYYSLRIENQNRAAQSMIQNMSLTTFMRTLDEFGKPDIRCARKKVITTFPDFISENYQCSENEAEEITILIKKNTLYIEKSIKLKMLDLWSDNRTAFEEISVRADRIGFMFFNMTLSNIFKKKYIEWLDVTFVQLWNKLAPYIEIMRKEELARSKFVVYFEKLAYLSFYFLRYELEDTEIIVLNKDTIQDLYSEYEGVIMNYGTNRSARAVAN